LGNEKRKDDQKRACEYRQDGEPWVPRNIVRAYRKYPARLSVFRDDEGYLCRVRSESRLFLETSG
jgi:hypothetical protein